MPPQVRPLQVRIHEVRTLQLSAHEGRTLEVGAGDLRALWVNARGVCALQVRAGEDRALQVGRVEARTPQTNRPKVKLDSLSTRRRAAIYTRISIDRAGDSESPERQEAACRNVAVQPGWEVVEVYSDRDASAFKSRSSRPGFDRLQYDVDHVRRRSGERRLVTTRSKTPVRTGPQMRSGHK